METKLSWKVKLAKLRNDEIEYELPIKDVIGKVSISYEYFNTEREALTALVKSLKQFIIISPNGHAYHPNVMVKANDVYMSLIKKFENIYPEALI